MSSTYKVLEQSQVCPPKGTVPAISLPISFLDIPWLPMLNPVERLYFYEFQHPTHHFIQQILPKIKHSLSLTLQHFFPLAGNLMYPSLPNNEPYILYNPQDSVTLTVIESASNFSRHLTFTSNQNVNEFDHLVPQLKLPNHISLETETFVLPLLALQVTIFPNSGICIGISYRHIIDGRTSSYFVKSWASFCKSEGNISFVKESLPVYDRTLIKDPNALEAILLTQYFRLLRSTTWKESMYNIDLSNNSSDNVRATLLVNREIIEGLREFVTAHRKNKSTHPQHLSKFVLTCSLIWVCLIKTQELTNSSISSLEDHELLYFSFAADIRKRLKFPVPATYFGNCLSICTAEARKGELVSENGFLKAVKALEGVMYKLKSDPLQRIEKWAPDLYEVCPSQIVRVAGSPKLETYGTDFGWGRPRKVDMVHFKDLGTISLAESRDEEGGIQIGLALPMAAVDTFMSMYESLLMRVH